MNSQRMTGLICAAGIIILVAGAGWFTPEAYEDQPHAQKKAAFFMGH